MQIRALFKKKKTQHKQQTAFFTSMWQLLSFCGSRFTSFHGTSFSSAVCNLHLARAVEPGNGRLDLEPSELTAQTREVYQISSQIATNSDFLSSPWIGGQTVVGKRSELIPILSQRKISLCPDLLFQMVLALHQNTNSIDQLQIPNNPQLSVACPFQVMPLNAHCSSPQDRRDPFTVLPNCSLVHWANLSSLIHHSEFDVATWFAGIAKIFQ